MNRTISYRLLIGAFIAFFFSVQSYSLAHVASHSDDHHDYECVTCDVTVLADDQAVIMPPVPVFETVISDTVHTVYADFSSAPFVNPQSRAPPPRAPPA